MSMYMSTANTSSQTSHEEMEDKSTDSTENKETTTATPTSKCKQWSKNEIVLVNLLTSNSFSPLQDPPEIPTRKETQDKPEGTNSQHSPNSNSTNNSSSSTNNSNEVNFLCHCNGTFLDMGQMFSSNQEVKYIKLHWLNMLDPTCKVKFTVFPKCSF